MTDEGPGLPASLRASAFDLARLPAADAPARGRGLGLGLSIARRLAELHGGTLVCRDDRSQGAEFVLRLPLSPKKPRKRRA
ncbi:MAG: ATP-binding protein [Elusimicrobiota bacterium]|nr:MAG: ATP-binding protein [Elusimicrobiota bacterium]